MNERIAHAAVALAQRMAETKGCAFQIDRGAIQDPSATLTQGLVVEAYTGRMHGLDWEGTYVWDPSDQTWSTPRIMAAEPDGVYTDESTPSVVPEDVRRRLDEIVSPLQEALEFGEGDRIVVEAAEEALANGALSPLTIEIVARIVAESTDPDLRMDRVEKPRPPTPAFGSFG